MLAHFDWAATADYAHPLGDGPSPTCVLVIEGRVPSDDVATLGRGLCDGGVLRLITHAPIPAEQIAALGEACGLSISGTNQDRVLTLYGCHAHYYVDLRRPVLTP